MGVTGGGAELADGAQTSAGKAERVIRENGLGSSVVILVLNLVDEGSDIDPHGTSLLTWTIGAFHATRGFSHGFLFCV